MIEETLAIILAGGRGSRLHPLTADRSKPAVPYGGTYRIIDFTLTNCLHSGLRRVLVLTQYKSHSLQKHLRDGWSIFNPELGEYINPVPPQMRTSESWYLGTANAIYQNLYLVERSGARWVVILSGDHIYRMDYQAMVQFHEAHHADLTIACMDVKIREAVNFGIMALNKEERLVGFEEKPANPQPLPGDAAHALASMGIYVFSTGRLIEALQEDHDRDGSDHDFGKDVIPRMIKSHKVFAYRFGGKPGRVTQDRYWRDVGTIDAYYEANIDLLKAVPPIDLYQSDWPIHTYAGQHPPARTAPGSAGNEGVFVNSIVASGTVIAGGHVEHSILFNNVYVDDGARVRSSLLFEGVPVGKGAQLSNSIVDKDVTIPDGERIGLDPDRDRQRFEVSENGVVVVPRGCRLETV